MKFFYLLISQLFLPAAMASADLIRSSNETEMRNFCVVPGAEQCDGPGKFVELRMESCNSSTNPCTMNNFTSPRRLELEYIPSVNITGLLCVLVTLVDGKFLSMSQVGDPNVNITKGVPATYGIDVDPWNDYIGKVVTLQLSLYNLDGGGVDICAEGDFKYVGENNFMSSRAPYVQSMSFILILSLTWYVAIMQIR